MRASTRAAAVLLVAATVVVAAVAMAPAGIAAWWVKRQSGGMITLADAQGSLWSGRARVTDTNGRMSVPLAWTVDRASLLHGVLALQFGNAVTDAIRGTLRITGAKAELTQASATVPAAMASLLLPAYVPLSLGGEVTLASPSFRFADVPQGNAVVRWLRARVADGQGRALDFGAVTATIAAQDAQVVTTLDSQGGDTALAGTVTVRGATIGADLSVSPRTAPAAPLLAFIALFGTAQPDGGVQFHYQGTWRGARP